MGIFSILITVRKTQIGKSIKAEAIEEEQEEGKEDIIKDFIVCQLGS